ncbi:MAG TPA: hypothetical protein P5179_01580 [Candidatus Latescibacteria bacterium]|nr:hypothetical protein [Candidatus Latescibacterota bacterium]
MPVARQPGGQMTRNELIEALKRLYVDCLVDWDRNHADKLLTSEDSAELGWGEAYVLRAFVGAYRFTGDVYWLRRLCAHAGAVLANAKDTPDGKPFDPVYADGFLGWGTYRYSGQYDEYMVHDGHICTPVAEFAAMVFADGRLYETFGEDATRFVRFIENHIAAKWLNVWDRRRDGDEEFAWGETVRNWGGLDFIPHNQYAAFGALLVFLDDVVRDPRYSSVMGAAAQTVYRQKAIEMGAYFKAHVESLPGTDAYAWKYHDTCGAEDTSHANLELEFAWWLHERGLVFSDSDMDRFAGTFANVMWNGDAEDPRVNASTDGKGDWTGGKTTWGWALFSRRDPALWHVLALTFLSESEAPTGSGLVAMGRLLEACTEAGASLPTRGGMQRG